MTASNASATSLSSWATLARQQLECSPEFSSYALTFVKILIHDGIKEMLINALSSNFAFYLLSGISSPCSFQLCVIRVIIDSCWHGKW